jgi:hypothetical protein
MKQEIREIHYRERCLHEDILCLYVSNWPVKKALTKTFLTFLGEIVV